MSLVKDNMDGNYSRFQKASKKLSDCTVIARLLARLEVIVG